MPPTVTVDLRIFWLSGMLRQEKLSARHPEPLVKAPPAGKHYGVV